MYVLYILWLRVRNANSFLRYTPDILVRSETTRREQKILAGTLKNIRPCIFFNCKICISQISFLCGITAIHGGTDTCYRENHNCSAFILEPSLEIKRVLRAEPTLLKIVVPDTRRRVNNTRRRAFCTSRTVIHSATP